MYTGPTVRICIKDLVLKDYDVEAAAAASAQCTIKRTDKIDFLGPPIQLSTYLASYACYFVRETDVILGFQGWDM